MKDLKISLEGDEGYEGSDSRFMLIGKIISGKQLYYYIMEVLNFCIIYGLLMLLI